MKTRDKSKGPESYTKVIIIQVMHGMARQAASRSLHKRRKEKVEQLCFKHFDAERKGTEHLWQKDLES